jgi:hypothetical protein
MILLYAYCIIYIVHVNGHLITLNIDYGVRNEIINKILDYKPYSIKPYCSQSVMEFGIPFAKIVTHQS